jgi:hypothetical protein
MAVSIRRRIAIPAFFIASAIALTLVMVWPDKKMISRDIGCAKVTPGRGREICQVLSDSMEWTWMGHAIISPGWRLTWKALRRVYCREKTSSADLSVLENLKMGSDWRLQDGADELIRLVGSRSGSAYESENSIFNPTNPQYILKNGCVGEQ